MLGDDSGLDNFDMRHYIKMLLATPATANEGAPDEQKTVAAAPLINELDGFMVYGTDV